MKKLLIFALALCVPLAACTDTAEEETSAVSETSALTEVFEETESESVPGEPDETGEPDDTDEADESEHADESRDADDAPSLADLRKELADNGAELGIAYLGYCDGDFDEIKAYLGELGLYELYSFAEELTSDALIENGNGEIYLVVPQYKDAAVKVYSAVMNTESFETEKGGLLGESANGKPFLVNCNVSEIMPSVIIETESLTYIPCISGEDGSLVKADGVYDFSPYDAVKAYFGITNGDIADGTDAVFCGTWCSFTENADGDIMTLILELLPDGSAAYAYGYGNSEMIEAFAGTWTFDAERDMILFDMFGGPILGYEGASYENPELYALKCGFKWNMNYADSGTVLTLVHEEGDPILWGKNGASFEFSPFGEMPTEADHLVGFWGIVSEKTEICLELNGDGTASYSVVGDGIAENKLTGTWYAADMTLYLELEDTDGTSGGISGAYGIMDIGEFLVLSPFDGAEPLTAFMQENGYDQFMSLNVG